jgi:hypothetical protein
MNKIYALKDPITLDIKYIARFKILYFLRFLVLCHNIDMTKGKKKQPKGRTGSGNAIPQSGPKFQASAPNVAKPKTTRGNARGR